MLKKEDIPYYIIAGIFFVAWKMIYRDADIETIKWLIRPTNFLFSLFINSSSTFDPELGYFHKELNIIINKSCSGGNFFILTIIMLILTATPKIKRHLFKLLFTLTAIGISYVFTILVNTSRIIVIYKFSELELDRYQWLHEAAGSFIYLLFLILFYQLVSYYLPKNTITSYE